jgi:acyl-CoA thioesterase-1
MNRLHCLGIVAVCLLGATVTAAAAAPKPPAKPKDPAFAEVKDDPALPRVLLLGDSISIGYTPAVRAALAGKANVHRAMTNCGPTKSGVAHMDSWLGDGKWAVIHFNFGLHDIKQIDGQNQVPIDEYEKNLRQLVARMKKTGAKLVWCSTTPVPEGDVQPPRRYGDVVAYNAVAKKIMDAEGVAINDLYAFALPKLKEIQQPVNVHFTAEGSKRLAAEVAAAISKALP